MNFGIIEKNYGILSPVWIFDCETLAEHLEELREALCSMGLFNKAIIVSAVEVNSTDHCDILEAPAERISWCYILPGPTVRLVRCRVKPRLINIDDPIALLQPPYYLCTKDGSLLYVDQGVGVGF